MIRNTLVKCLCFLFVLTVVGCTHDTDVVKIKTLDAISKKLNSVHKDALVVFDVDDVLITPIDPFFILALKILYQVPLKEKYVFKEKLFWILFSISGFFAIFLPLLYLGSVILLKQYF